MSTPDPIVAAIERLSSDQRAGFADMRRALARVNADLHAELARLAADLAAVRADMTQVVDAVADVARNLREHTHDR